MVPGHTRGHDRKILAMPLAVWLTVVLLAIVCDGDRQLKLSTFRHCRDNVNAKTGARSGPIKPAKSDRDVLFPAGDIENPHRLNITGLAMSTDPVLKVQNFSFTMVGVLNGPPVTKALSRAEGFMVIRQMNVPDTEIARMRMQGHHVERINPHQVAMRWQNVETPLSSIASGNFSLGSSPSRINQNAPTGRYRIRQTITAASPNPGEVLCCIEIGFEVVDKMPSKEEIEAARARDERARAKERYQKIEEEHRRQHRVRT